MTIRFGTTILTPCNGSAVQAKSPGKDKESNWLPAARGPFFAVLRIY